MKKLLCVLLVAIFSFSLAIQVLAADSLIMPRYNNVDYVNTEFNISDSGKAIVRVQYMGIEGETTGATITTKIEKKFLWWWNDVDDASWTDQATGYNFSTTHSVDLSSGGTYRCTYEYSIYGTGATDEISGEIEREY
ncbi:MAG: hypothetical protein IJF11_03840 [Clostridia bacterium]|nr:hypothetical protein [Clostridia bacterium]